MPKAVVYLIHMPTDAHTKAHTKQCNSQVKYS